MNKSATMLSAILVLGFAGVAEASGAFSMRIGAQAGNYAYEDSVQATDVEETSYGILGGARLVTGRFFVDLGMDYVTVDAEGFNDKTDTLLTLGVFTGDRWTIFGGYRRAIYGDGFYADDSGSSDHGPYLGLGLSFGGDAFRVSTSLAASYIFLEHDDPATQAILDEINAYGFSFKILGAFPSGTSIFLRAQQYQGDFDSGGVTFDYKESLYFVGVEQAFALGSW